MSDKNYFEELNSVDCSDKIEEKGGLKYLSWAWAWAEIKKKHPNAASKVYEREDGRIYWDDGKTAWVKTGVTINEIEHIEYLPILDSKNKPIAVENITSFNVNTAIQRSITKACARHGLGLYIYAGEDIPEQAVENKKQERIQVWLETIDKLKSKDDVISFWSKASDKLNSFAKREDSDFKNIYEQFYYKVQEFECEDIIGE